MKNLPMGDKRWKKHIDAILGAARAKKEAKDKKYKSTKLKHDGKYLAPPKKP